MDSINTKRETRMKVYIVIRRILDDEMIIGVFRSLDAAKIGTKGFARISAHDFFRVEEHEITEDAAETEAKFQAAHDRAEKQLANNRRIFHGRG